MGNETYLMAANAVVFAGLAGYVLFLAGRFSALERRIRRMEALRDDHE